MTILLILGSVILVLGGAAVVLAHIFCAMFGYGWHRNEEP